MDNTTCTFDTFAASLVHILQKIDDEVVAGVPKVVKNGAKKAKKLTVQKSEGAGWHQGITHAKYVSGWAYTVQGSGRLVEAEIGNRATPGLPHLLEKGHAKVGGGRTTAYEHVAPAAEEAFDYTFEEMEKMVDRALV